MAPFIDREDAAAVAPRRNKGGRPRRTGPPPVPTSLRIPVPVYDALCRRALTHGCSVHRLITLALVQFVHGTPERPGSA